MKCLRMTTGRCPRRSVGILPAGSGGILPPVGTGSTAGLDFAGLNRFSFLQSPRMATPEKPDMHSEKFLHSLMRRQLRLSISCAAAFVTVLLGLPLANYFFPEFMAQR